MKSSIIITFLLFVFSATAQNVSVSGTIKDTAKQPVPFADVLLLTVKDSVIIKNTLANEEGLFEIKGITRGSYIIKVSAIGFNDHFMPVSLQSDMQVPPVILEESIKMLDEVEVTSKRPIVRRKIDRLEFDVENSTLSSDNAWEIVKKTPGVSSLGGGLSIRGSSGIIVTINDKRVYLSGSELQYLLENTSGDEIKSIEVITNPPAKYEAQGTAVLNIKMKKSGLKGYKGSLSGAYVQGVYPKGVLFTSQQYKNDKFRVYGSYSLGTGTYLEKMDSRAAYRDSNGQIASVWKSDRETAYKALSQNGYNFNAEYQLDSLNSINIGTNGFSSLKSTAQFYTKTGIYNGTGQLDSLYNTHNRRDYPQKNNTINAAYEHKFSTTANIVVAADYTSHYFNQNQDVISLFSLPDETVYRTDRFTNEDTRRINLFSAQADFVDRKEKSGFEGGVRFGRVDADNSLDFRNEVGGVLVVNTGLSNQFIYDESIFAGYVGYDREFGKWTLKGGLRGELTRIEGTSVTTGEVNTQDYFKIFPTLYTLYKPTDNHHIGASYGKRIVRPQYDWLNPFRSYDNPYAYTSGDPGLQPTISHNYSILYTLNNKYNFDLFYRHDKDPSMQITYQDYATNTLVTQITNIRSNDSYGLSMNTNLVLFPWWDMGLQAGVNNFENTFQGVDGGLYTNNKWNYGTYTDNRFTLNKKKDLIAQASFYYNSPAVQGTNTYSAMSNLTLSIRKKFLDGNGEITLIGGDLLRGEIVKATTDYANQYNFNKSYGENRYFRVQFRYNFGNQKLDNGRVRDKTDEQQRL